jgi:hypothetical protein
MTHPAKNLLGARAKFDTGTGEAYIYRLGKLTEDGYNIARSPFR